MGCIKADTFRITGIKDAISKRVSGIISASCGIICTVNKKDYIRVNPVEMQWIDVDKDVIYDISSNTYWQLY